VNDFLYAGESLDAGAIHPSIVAHQAHGGPLPPRHRTGLVAHLNDHVADPAHLLVAGAVPHDDEHLHRLPFASRTPTMVETPGSCIVTP
jgi:hypothetical protein